MTPGKVRAGLVLQRSALVDEMLGGAAALPLADIGAFSGDRVRDAMLAWLRAHPESVDGDL